MYKNIQIKKDGTYVIDFNNMPFHITEDYPKAEQYGEEMTYTKVKEYADSHQDEVTEYQDLIFKFDPDTEKQILIMNKEKEKTDIMAYILAGIDVEENKEKLKTVILEINKLKQNENIKILNSVSPTLAVKGNTKYRLTPQVEEIAVSGENVNLNYKLRYIRHDHQKTNPVTEDVVFKQFSLKNGNILTLAPVEFTTGNYVGDNFIHTFYFIADSSNSGTLASNVAFNVSEVKE